MPDEGKDAFWMAQALALAERGRGYVEPNPLVGAIVVRDGELVGIGWHERFGGAHAEVGALKAAGSKAQGATLYVTLEPCCHHGKTPPCTDAIIAAGIRRVVAALVDPFSQVAGKGIDQLRAAGIRVDVGTCAEQARQLNAPYFKLIQTGTPYVHAKWAMSLDGKIATAAGDSKWISSEESRRVVHELRGRMDAIVVGIGTVLRDDPLLTARPKGARVPMRIVLDSHGRIPENAQLIRTIDEAPVVLAVTDCPAERKDALTRLGCEVWSLSTRFNRPDVTSLLEELGKRKLTNILIEGGAEVFGSFLDARAIDEVHVFVAPKLIGGTEAKSAVGGKGIAQIADALELEDRNVEARGKDIVIHGRIGKPGKGNA
ncbi:MAG: riboflavin biosynthesis protein RibD [Gemmatales bacterium]|nr:MAG: riboflavin biosynthesis protein RibD [Gemmatales bacterium]